MSGLPTECDLGYPDTEGCGKPVRFYALSACPPMLWSDAAGASPGGFSCLQHAEAEPRPGLDASKKVYGMVLEGMGCVCGDAYPNPVGVERGAPR